MTASDTTIREEFTFRSEDKVVVLPSKIDTGADRTIIPSAVAEGLGLLTHADEQVGVPGGGTIRMPRCMCYVAWTIYESHGFRSVLDVWWDADSVVPLIGADFLALHELSVDYHHRGLVGHAPEGAEPVTGGGYVINAPPGFIRKLNGERFRAAEPGTVLRPHPAWRFTRPSGTKMAQGS